MPDYTRNSSLLDWRDSPRLWFGNFPMSGWTVYDPVLLTLLRDFYWLLAELFPGR